MAQRSIRRAPTPNLRRYAALQAAAGPPPTRAMPSPIWAMPTSLLVIESGLSPWKQYRASIPDHLGFDDTKPRFFEAVAMWRYSALQGRRVDSWTTTDTPLGCRPMYPIRVTK